MKRLLLVLVVFVFSLTLPAQEKNKAFTVSPAVLTNRHTIAIQPGFQFSISEKISMLSEVAIPIMRELPENMEEFNTFRLRTELKYYIEKAIERRYVGAQLGYTYRRLTDMDSGAYWQAPYSKYVGYSKAEINSPVFFFNLTFGSEMMENKKLFWDYFVAAGVRFIPTRFESVGVYNKQYVDNSPTCVMMPTPDPAWLENRNYIRPGINAGVRLGFKL